MRNVWIKNKKKKRLSPQGLQSPHVTGVPSRIDTQRQSIKTQKFSYHKILIIGKPHQMLIEKWDVVSFSETNAII